MNIISLIKGNNKRKKESFPWFSGTYRNKGKEKFFLFFLFISVYRSDMAYTLYFIIFMFQHFERVLSKITFITRTA